MRTLISIATVALVAAGSASLAGCEEQTPTEEPVNRALEGTSDTTLGPGGEPSTSR